MRSLFTRSLFATAGCCLLLACADTHQYIAPELPDQPVAVVAPTFQEVMDKWSQHLPFGDYVDPVEAVPTDPADPDYDDFIENQEFKAARVVTLCWDGAQVTVDNPQAEKGVDITTVGGHAVIRNLESDEGADDARGKVTYRLTGHSADGQLKVYSDKKCQLLLDDLHLTCADGPAISIQHKKRCFITLAEGSVNELTDAPTYASDSNPTDEDEKAALFSEGQLIFSGQGQLHVTGLHQHGIASDEYIRIHPGCRIEAQGVKDGIHSKEQYHQSGSLVFAYGLKDGLQADSIGVRLTGGNLYLFGERPVSSCGEPRVDAHAPAKVCLIYLGDGQ